MIVGYTSGVFDLFHIGHLNILKKSKDKCDKLIVGVTTDELLLDYKNKKPVINFRERCQIVESIKYVDEVVAQNSMNKMAQWEKLKFDVIFVGNDWQYTKKWKAYEREFNEVNVKIVYFEYTKGTSSTLINEILLDRRKKL